MMRENKRFLLKGVDEAESAALRASGIHRCRWRQGQFGELLTPGLPQPDLEGV